MPVSGLNLPTRCSNTAGFLMATSSGLSYPRSLVNKRLFEGSGIKTVKLTFLELFCVLCLICHQLALSIQIQVLGSAAFCAGSDRLGLPGKPGGPDWSGERGWAAGEADEAPPAWAGTGT